MIANVRTALSKAPVVVIVVNRSNDGERRPPKWEQDLTVGAVCMNLIVAATAFGFGSIWLTGWLAVNKSAHAVLGVAQGEAVAGIIHIGTPTQRPSVDRKRPDLAEIVAYWGAGS